jgi:hypothetical protein
VQIYVAAGDSHQEHITAQTFETIIQGAAVNARGVDQRLYKPGDNLKQRFARQETGFAVFELSPAKIAIRFYDEKAREIYDWNASSLEIGLSQSVPTRPSAEQRAMNFGID